MEKQFEKYKGIHPGFVLERELKRRLVKQRPFALSIAEHPQSFNAIIKGRRGINTALALRIEKELHLEEGTFVMLQAYHDIRKEKEKPLTHSRDLSILRKSLFWDTDINRIDWQQQSNAVIERVLERGNDQEKEEIAKFYGKAKIMAALSSEKRKSQALNQRVLKK